MNGRDTIDLIAETAQFLETRRRSRRARTWSGPCWRYRLAALTEPAQRCVLAFRRVARHPHQTALEQAHHRTFAEHPRARPALPRTRTAPRWRALRSISAPSRVAAAPRQVQRDRAPDPASRRPQQTRQARTGVSAPAGCPPERPAARRRRCSFSAHREHAPGLTQSSDCASSVRLFSTTYRPTPTSPSWPLTALPPPFVRLFVRPLLA